MYSKRIRNRFHQTLPVLWAAFATADAVSESARRQCGDGMEVHDPTPAAVTGGMFVLLGKALIAELRHLLAADGRYQRLRERQRRRQTRRDAVAGRLYHLMVHARKFLKGAFGYSGACEYVGLQGPTEREPKRLDVQASEAVYRARHPIETPTPVYAGAERDAEKVVDEVDGASTELRDALDAVGLGRFQTDAAMLEQRRAMKDFDRIAIEIAHYLEEQLFFFGLPTLAAAVRPGVGRRGRPLKERPVDLHRDLVEQALARDLFSLDVAELESLLGEFAALVTSGSDAGEGSARDSATSKGVGNGSEGSSAVASAEISRSEGLGKIESPCPERSASEEIIAQALPESSGGKGKIEPPLPERSASEGKIESPLPERPTADEKSGHRVPESSQNRTSDVFSRLTLPPPIAPCAARPYRRHLATVRPRVAAGRRSGGVAAEGSKLRWLQRASAWWVRMRRAA